VVAKVAARDRTGVEVAGVALTQALLLAAFQVLPAAAVLFLTFGLEAAARLRLAFAHLYVVAPLGLGHVLFTAAALALLARAVSRLTPATAGEATFEPGPARRLRAFPASISLAGFLGGTLAYAICAVLSAEAGAAGAQAAAVLVAGAAAALIYALVSYAAAERYLIPLFAFLTVRKIKFARRRYVPLGARYAIVGGCGAASVIVLAAGGFYARGAVGWGAGQWLVAALLVALAALAAYLVSRHVTAPLGTAAKAAPITYYVGDELEELTAACRAFRDEVRVFDEAIRRVASDLSGNAARVRENLAEQASITSQQASAISETSVTMKELSETVGQTATRAEEISERVDSSARSVKTAQDQILTNAENIERLAAEAQNAAKLAVALNESARRMDEIVALVNDLAEQSTVLALNAAIEAAKAGEFGRGFSAVAREVKNLASSSKEGTEEIRKVLHEIRDGTVKTVTSARASAEQSDILRDGAARAKSLVEEIVPFVEEIGRMSKQIAASARQQSLGLEQVTAAVENINEAANEALSQANAVRGAVDNIAQISSRLAEEAEAPGWRKGL
jgi:methyl-accepting chemotaxis protein